MAIRAVLPSVHGDVPYLTMRSSSRHKEQRKLSFFPFFALVDGRRRPCDTLKVILSGHDLAGPRDVEPGNEKGQKVVGATSEVWPPVVVVFCGRSQRGPAPPPSGVPIGGISCRHRSFPKLPVVPTSSSGPWQLLLNHLAPGRLEARARMAPPKGIQNVLDKFRTDFSKNQKVLADSARARDDKIKKKKKPVTQARKKPSTTKASSGNSSQRSAQQDQAKWISEAKKSGDLPLGLRQKMVIDFLRDKVRACTSSSRPFVPSPACPLVCFFAGISSLVGRHPERERAQLGGRARPEKRPTRPPKSVSRPGIGDVLVRARRRHFEQASAFGIC